jgi:hypothetical protein
MGQPEAMENEGDMRQQPRRPFDERPRPHFDRSRNGGDQPRQPRIEDEADGWDGPQPQFLRRSQTGQAQPNGGDRQQRDRRPGRERGQRAREEAGSASPESTDAQGVPEPDTPVR